jgi:transposase
MKVYIGIDWSKEKHDIVYMNEQGGVIVGQTVAATPAGYEALDEQRRKLGVDAEACLVGIETEHNPLVDYLSASGYSQIYILPPSKVHASRGRFRQSGASSDQKDAQLIADIVRTDEKRLRVWRPNSDLTQQLEILVSLEHFLCHNQVQLVNRLRSVLWRYYPQATQVFCTLDSQIALEFIIAYPNPQAAASLSYAEFEQFAQQHRYRKPKLLPGCFARLQSGQSRVSLAKTHAFQSEAVRLATLVLTLEQERSQTQRQIQLLFNTHADARIFASLPGVGAQLAPALLVKFGDDRQRFPDPGSLQALAGTCPITKSSGKGKVVLFRVACDHEFRTLVQLWARASLAQSVWANTYFRSILPRSRSISAAYRCLANRWLAIAWRLWQDRTLYSQEYHLQHHALRSQSR